MWARLIMITLAYERLFTPLSRHLLHATGRRLSLMKFMRYLTRHLGVLTALLDPAPRLGKACTKALLRYCAYDKRRRSNFSLDMDLALAHVRTHSP